MVQQIIESSVDKEGLLRELRAILPNEMIIHQQEALRPYECDGLAAYRQMPLLVVLPETVAQVQAVMALCYRLQVPVVARGAATGLSGGALPLANGVLLSLAKFTQIISVDPLARTARVQPGVRNLAISDAVAPHGLYYAPDPSSQLACTIGGNIAENAGGVHCLKYGLTVHNVLQLTLVTMEGELITLGGESLDSPGFDLLALMIGSEGMLGVVVEAVVRLLPKPEVVEVLLAAFDQVEVAAGAVGEIIAAGILPAGLEMMDGFAIRAVESFAHCGYPQEAEAILLCEVDGTEAEVADQVRRVETLLRSQGAIDVQVAQNASERASFWKGRKSAFPAMGRLTPDYYCMDGTVPRRRLADVLIGIEKLSEQYGLPVANVFHAGDGNLHPLILFDSNKANELETAETLGGEILTLCVEVGGTITGEHGVGNEKVHHMCVQFRPEELEQFRQVKRAFDPRGLLNPGKVIPEPGHCAEYKEISRDAAVTPSQRDGGVA